MLPFQTLPQWSRDMYSVYYQMTTPVGLIRLPCNWSQLKVLAIPREQRRPVKDVMWKNTLWTHN